MKICSISLNPSVATRLLVSPLSLASSPLKNPALVSSSASRVPLRLAYQKSKIQTRCYSAMASSIHSVKDRVDLTPKEKQIFERLVEVVRHYSLQTQLRVAGGWVRDKLLGKECYDIDIALDNMSGNGFCEKVNQYLSDAGEETHGIGVIQCNPEQSKHLETARIRLFDEWIDFVNLRSEDYSETSRIPTMRFGTPKEDAYRRDLTINSLFYNINDDRVEDLTGRGIEDLKSGRIVTPLPPKQTFLDDPLRVLRAIRFGARFGFELDEELKTAASDVEVVAAIEDKISRERIGKEIDLMVSGNQPVKAMGYVSELQLFGAVFHLPLTEPPVSDGFERLCVDLMGSASKLLEAIECSFTVDQKRLCLYGALFLPLRGVIYKEKEKKGKEIPVVDYIFRNSLKLKASDADTVVSLHIAAKRFLSLIHYITSNDNIQSIEVDWKSEIIDVVAASKLRVLVGLLLRDIKDFWRPALVLCMLLNSADSESVHSSELEEQKKLYKMVEGWIVRQNLDKIWEVKPLVNGKQIMSLLNLQKGGPLVKEWVHKLLEWQLAHPSATEEECIYWMTKVLQNKRAKVESEVATGADFLS